MLQRGLWDAAAGQLHPREAYWQRARLPSAGCSPDTRPSCAPGARQRPVPHRFVVAVISDRHQQVDGSDQLAASITQRSWIGSKWNPCAVRALRLRRHAADLPVLFDGHRHWALIVGQLRPVGPEQPPGSAPPGTAQLWMPAPQIGRSSVVEGEVTVGIGKIDRGRQCLEQIAGQDPAVSKHLLNWLRRKAVAITINPTSCDSNLPYNRLARRLELTSKIGSVPAAASR